MLSENWHRELLAAVLAGQLTLTTTQLDEIGLGMSDVIGLGMSDVSQGCVIRCWHVAWRTASLMSRD